MHVGSLIFSFKKAARLARCERGATAIEFAFVAPIIVAIILATLQVSIIYTAQSYLEASTESAMRYVMTNQAQGLTQTNFNQQVCNTGSALFNCSGLVIQLEPVTCAASVTAAQCVASMTPQPDKNGNYTSPTTFNAGAQKTKMALVVLYKWPVIGGPLGLNFSTNGYGYHLLAATQVFYTEPCTSTQPNCV